MTEKQFKHNDNDCLNYHVFIENGSVHISLEEKVLGANLAFIDIYTNRLEINSPFKSVNDAKKFGEVIVKILSDMND